MPITPIVTAILALIFLALSINVIRFRLKYKVSLGDDGHDELITASRAHANFIEYVPISLFLLWFLETLVYVHQFVAVLGAALVIGRLMHAYGLLNEVFLLRRLGMLLTFLVLLIGSIRLLWHFLPL